MHQYNKTKSKYTHKIGAYSMGENGHSTLNLKFMLSKVRLKEFEIIKKHHTFHINDHSQNILPVSPIFCMCHSKIPCIFSLSGKSENQIPCFSCVVATMGTLVLQGLCLMKNTYHLYKHYLTIVKGTI